MDSRTDASLVTVTEQPLLTAIPVNASSYQITVQQVGDTWVGRWDAGNGNTEADTLEECLANMAEVITLIQDDDDE